MLHTLQGPARKEAREAVDSTEIRQARLRRADQQGKGRRLGNWQSRERTERREGEEARRGSHQRTGAPSPPQHLPTSAEGGTMEFSKKG